MKRNWIVGAIVALLLIAGVGWYFASPGYALSQLRDAAVAGDVDELEQRIDFPAVRESLKAQVRAAMLAEVAKQGEDNGFGALGGMLAMGMIGPMIDSVITPEGMKMMMEQGKLADIKDEAPPVDEPEANWTIDRRSFDRFAATPDAKNGDKVPSLIFERDGLGWRLVKMDIPAGGLGGKT